RPRLTQTPVERQGLAVGGEGLAQVAPGAIEPAEVVERPPRLALAAEGAEERQGLLRTVEIGAGAGHGVEDVGFPAALAQGAKAGQGLGEGRGGEETLGGHAGTVAGGRGA